MRIVAIVVLGGILGTLALVGPVAAQEVLVLQGTVEDAITLQPLPGVRVIAADSSTSVLTDGAGAFLLRLPAGAPLVLYAEGIGYASQRFDLPPEARLRRTILRLEPAPVVLEGVTAVAEEAIETLQRNIRSRRNGYAEGPVWGFDRAWLDRFGPRGGSVFDLVRQRWPQIRPCRNDGTQLCRPGRGRTLSNPYPEVQILVCIDDWMSLGPSLDLSGLSIESVALVELIGRARVNVYTPGWMQTRARQGRTWVLPLIMGC